MRALSRHLMLALALGLAAPAVLVSQERPAQAQPESRPLAQSLKGQSLADYSAGRLLFEDGDFNGSFVKFEAAFKSSKDPRLLWNMAACQKSLRHYVRVRELLVEYLADESGIVKEANRAQAKELLATLTPLIGSVRLAVTPADATVAVDGAPVADSLAPLSLDLGSHTVSVTKPGFAASTTKVDITDATAKTVTVALHAQDQSGHLVITAPAGAVVMLDGKMVGQGATEASASAGLHTLRVEAKGKQPFEGPIEVRTGETRTIPITLTDEKHGVPAWPFIVGGIILAAGAATLTVVLLTRKDPDQPAGTLSPGLINLQLWR